MEVTLPYLPRPWQERFRSSIGSRQRAFLLWARRHGKDVACWNYLIVKALQRVGIYYYLYPMQNQARKAMWEGMTSEGFRFLDYIPRELRDGNPNNTEMMIKLVNGSIIRIIGSDNHVALRGSNPIGVVLSEYAYHHPLTWQAIIEPILQENGGWALFNTTPFGKNHAYDIWQYAQQHPHLWYTEKVTLEDSNLFPISELDEMRKRGVTDETIFSEYYCDWNRGVEGSYYGKIIHDLRIKGRMKTVAADPYLQVFTAWDLGFGDSTSIWFYQLCGNEIHVIDFYENHGEGLAHYISILETKKSVGKWIYGAHYVPHDAAAGSFEIGMSRIKYANELGITMTVLPRERVDHGIERVRRWLPRFYFDETKCEYGIKCIESYRKTYNDKLKVYSDEPLHDFSSHSSDALRYLCQALELGNHNSKMSLDEYRKKKEAAGIYGIKRNDSILGN